MDQRFRPTENHLTCLETTEPIPEKSESTKQAVESVDPDLSDGNNNISYELYSDSDHEDSQTKSEASVEGGGGNGAVPEQKHLSQENKKTQKTLPPRRLNLDPPDPEHKILRANNQIYDASLYRTGHTDLRTYHRVDPRRQDPWLLETYATTHTCPPLWRRWPNPNFIIPHTILQWIGHTIYLWIPSLHRSTGLH